MEAVGVDPSKSMEAVGVDPSMTADEAKKSAEMAEAKAKEAQAVAEKAKKALEAILKQQGLSTSEKQDCSGSGPCVPPISLELMYESQCPYSLLFLQDLAKVLPAMYGKQLKDRVNLQLSPFGNAQAVPTKSISEGYKFWHPEVVESGQENVYLCQHGEGECLGNMIHMCAMQLQQDPLKFINFLGCMADNPNFSVEKASYECAAKLEHDIDIKAIKKCALGPDGVSGMDTAHKRTAKHTERKWVPWVVVNNVHAPSAENGYLERLLCTVELGTVPEGGNFPQACNSIELLQVQSVLRNVSAPLPTSQASAEALAAFSYGIGSRDTTRLPVNGGRIV
eukprot:gnl/TRDRNA2_/TRDRNA2_153378_c1_seq2.p1 gnl/TRDRNA2_/TRDRNA2_153378_c1~~gnl/TRDRNA2_/TRDRNA2_153378_c1_seq2.p1  ORF type:complete len:369 (-),score=91.95 gnl/TRDRNA2_/TRDRNA2_153378_c1_seq2:57-1067(-)